MCITESAKQQEESFCGSIKSFNTRRGFGFVSCAETAERFGRDVYLSKDEAMTLAVEPAVGQAAPDNAATDERKNPPVQEGDFLLFQVKLSTEGFPQAVQVRRIRRLHGVVQQAPSTTADGIIIVTGEGGDGAEGADLQQLLGAEVRVKEAECGQLQLLPKDKVAFGCANTTEAEGPALEARLIDLIHTSRAAGSLLGCFSLSLPCPPSKRATEAIQDGSTARDESRYVQLSGYALTERVLLSEVPLDVGAPGLMRLFKKLGGLDISIIPSSSDNTCGFASITFSGPESIAKFLVQATHTVSETGITQLAHVSTCSDSSTASWASEAASEASLGSSTSAGMQPGPTAPAESAQHIHGQTLCLDSQLAQPHTSTPWSCSPCALPAAADFGTAQPQQMSQAISFSSPPSWRCVHGSVVVPAAAPEVLVAGENGCSVCVQWPTVIHASAYLVELLDQGTMVSQRFMHVAPAGQLPAVMDVRVDGLSPSVYGACVRCIAPCGCESLCSPWSFVKLGWAQPAGIPLMGFPLLSLPPNAPAAVPIVGLPTCPPPSAPPSVGPLLATAAAPTATLVLPPIPEEAGDAVATCSDDILTLD